MGDNLLFKVVAKMFAVAALEPSAVWMSLKANPENFAELTERHGNHPRALSGESEVDCLESQDSLPAAENCGLLRESYELVAGQLPRKLANRREGGRRKPTQKRSAGAKQKEENEVSGKTNQAQALEPRRAPEAGGHREAETSFSRNYFFSIDEFHANVEMAVAFLLGIDDAGFVERWCFRSQQKILAGDEWFIHNQLSALLLMERVAQRTQNFSP